MSISVSDLLFNLEVEEVAIVFLANFAMAIHAGLSSRCDALSIPWFETLLRPAYYGGWREIARHAGLLLLWGTLCAGLGLGFAASVRSGEGVVRAAYQASHYPHEPRAGMATLVATSMVVVYYAIRRTRALTIAARERVPRSVLEPGARPSVLSTEASVVPKELVKQLGAAPSGWRKRARDAGIPIRLVLNFIPIILVPIYKQFFCRIGDVIRATAYLLLEKYSEEVVVDFYPRWKKEESDPRYVDLDRTLEDAETQRERACTILIGLIRIWGYHSTRQRIEAFIRDALDRKSVREQFELNGQLSADIAIRHAASRDVAEALRGKIVAIQGREVLLFADRLYPQNAKVCIELRGARAFGDVLSSGHSLRGGHVVAASRIKLERTSATDLLIEKMMNKVKPVSGPRRSGGLGN